MEEQPPDENASNQATIIDMELGSAPPVPIREHLIKTAVRFLGNPSVQRSPIPSKQKFLRNKGLTEDEIQIACERAGVFTSDPNASKTIISMGVGTYQPSAALVPHSPTTMMGRIKDILSSMALISGLAYGLYLLYKKFIEPLIFRTPKKKTVEEQIADVNRNIDTKIDKVNEELVKINGELTRNVQVANITKDISSLKSDIETIRGLLLNKKQFAAPNLPVVPPSIPQWQLSSVQPQQHLEHLAEEEHEIHDKNDDTGSGGSSEGEVVTKNSDSSLEIIS